MIVMNTNPLKNLLMLLAILSLVVGCKAVGPDYVKPAANSPAAYKEAHATKPIGQLSGLWWTLYANEELNSLIAQVESQNYTLQAMAAKSQQARAMTEVAEAAKLPSVMFQPLPGRRNDLGAIARWEIDLWGRIQRNIEASGAAAEASAADLAGMKLSLQAQLAEHYFNLRVQDQQIALLQQSIALEERHLTVIQNQYAVGVADRSAVLQVQSKLNEVQAQLHEARVNRALWEHAIAVLIGKPPADFSIAPSTTHVGVPDIPLALPADLLQRRPDIAAAERRMASASAKIGEAEASAYPTLSLFAGVSLRSGLIGGPSVTVPIYSGGQNKAKQTEASSAYAEAVADYQQTVLNGFREVEDGLASLQSLAAAADNSAAALKASRSSAIIMHNQLKVGVINYPLVVGAELAQLESEKLTLAILAKRLSASVSLIKALGGGWQASDLDSNTTPESKP